MKGISAIIVTRGDVDLTEILDTLPYDEVIIYDNSTKPENARCFGRYLAIAEANYQYIYFQDDDIVFTEHEKLIDAYFNPLNFIRPARFVSNMPSPWWEEQYERFDMALVGAGSIMDRGLPWAAFGKYLARYPKDELFLNYCDMVFGALTPYRRFDFGYKILPCAHWPGRVHTRPGAAAEKQSVIDRALALRDR